MYTSVFWGTKSIYTCRIVGGAKLFLLNQFHKAMVSEIHWSLTIPAYIQKFAERKKNRIVEGFETQAYFTGRKKMDLNHNVILCLIGSLKCIPIGHTGCNTRGQINIPKLWGTKKYIAQW